MFRPCIWKVMLAAVLILASGLSVLLIANPTEAREPSRWRTLEVYNALDPQVEIHVRTSRESKWVGPAEVVPFELLARQGGAVEFQIQLSRNGRSLGAPFTVTVEPERDLLLKVVSLRKEAGWWELRYTTRQKGSDVESVSRLIGEVRAKDLE